MKIRLKTMEQLKNNGAKIDANGALVKYVISCPTKRSGFLTYVEEENLNLLGSVLEVIKPKNSGLYHDKFGNTWLHDEVDEVIE